MNLGTRTEPPPAARATDLHASIPDTDVGAFFELSLDLLCIAGLDGYFKLLNPAWQRLLGFRLEELCAAPLLDFVHPEDRESTAAAVARIASGARPVHFENRCRHADGTYRWISWKGNRHPGGDLIFAVARDITEQRRSEQELRASEQRFRLLIDSTPGGLLIADEAGRIVLANQLVEEMFGYGNGELARQPVEILLPEGLRRGHEQLRSRFAKAPKQRPMAAGRNLVARRKDGAEFPVTVGLAPLPSDEGTFVAAAITDMTEQRRVEGELLRANDLLQARIADLQALKREAELISEMGEMLQASHGTTEANRVIEMFARQLFTRGAGSVELVQESRSLTESVVSWGTAEAGEHVFHPGDCWALRRGKPHAVGDDPTRIVCPHLQPLDPLRSLCVPLLAQGEALGVLTIRLLDKDEWPDPWPQMRRLASNFADHLALALANLRLRNTLQLQSIRDPVTGLFNRRYLEETLEREVARAERQQTTLGIIMLDLDHFKEFNDSFGHRAGDTALVTLGALLPNLVRGEDVPCRYGGEEFAVLLPGATTQHAADRAEQIRRVLADVPLRHAGRDLGHITMSAGVAAFPDHARTPEDLLASADGALYRAKSEGRNRVAVVGAP